MVACRGACTLAALVLAAAAALPAPAAAYDTGSWVDGRATFFGEDAWSLHEGACGYGFICPNRWSDELVSGRDVVAISDVSALYKAGGACGQCLEVKCRDATITDADGESYDRAGSQYCKAGHPSVKVKITDRCDCHYAANAASNARWCCGDAPHLDVSQWALEKITKDVTKWGVFAIEYRTVDCKAEIANEAPAVPLSQQDPDPHDAAYRKGTDCAAQATGSKGSSGSGSGGVTTESSGSASRATTARSSKPTPKPFPDHNNKGGNHSQHFWARRRALNKARGFKSLSPGFYNRLMDRWSRIIASDKGSN